MYICFQVTPLSHAPFTPPLLLPPPPPPPPRSPPHPDPPSFPSSPLVLPHPLARPRPPLVYSTRPPADATPQSVVRCSMRKMLIIVNLRFVV